MTQELREMIARCGWRTYEHAGLVTFMVEDPKGNPLGFQVPVADDAHTVANLVREAGNVTGLSNRVRSLIPALKRLDGEASDVPGISEEMRSFLGEHGWDVGANPHRRALRDEVFVSLKGSPEAGFAFPASVSDREAAGMLVRKADMCMGIARRVRSLAVRTGLWAAERDIGLPDALPGWKDVAREAGNEHRRLQTGRKNADLSARGWYHALHASLPSCSPSEEPSPERAWEKGHDAGMRYLGENPSLTDRAVDLWLGILSGDPMIAASPLSGEDRQGIDALKAGISPDEALDMLDAIRELPVSPACRAYASDLGTSSRCLASRPDKNPDKGRGHTGHPSGRGL